jgi:inner membrane protein
MYRWGHVGAALLAYAPLGAVLTVRGDPTLAAVGFAVAIATATLPDADELLPIDHRGPTHTVWFLLVCSAVGVAVGVAVGSGFGRTLAFGVVLGTAVAVSLGSHLLADSITPMGVRPFAPLSGWHHSFDLTPAANPRANAALLSAGSAVALLSQAFLVL